MYKIIAVIKIITLVKPANVKFVPKRYWLSALNWETIILITAHIIRYNKNKPPSNLIFFLKFHNNKNPIKSKINS